MSVRKSLSWAFACQIVTVVVSFAGMMVLARLLSPLEVGINAIAVAGLGVVQIIATMGLAGYVIRDTDLQPGTLDLTFSVNAMLAVILSALLLLISMASASLLGDARAGQVLRILAITPVLNAFAFRASAMLQREMRFKAFALINTGMTTVTTGLTVALAWMGQSYMSAAYGGVGGAVFGVIAFNLVAPHHASLRITFKGWREVARFGLQIMSISGLATLATRLSDLILGRVLGIAALGIYSRASMTSSMIFENVYGTTTRVAFTKLARDYRETGELRPTFLRAIELILALMWPLEIGLAILSPPAIYLFYGEKWLAAALPLSLLLVAQAIVLSYGMNWELFVLRNETGKQSRLEFIRTLCGFAIFTVGCQFGLAGAALGKIGDASAGYLLYRNHVRNLAELRGNELGMVFARSALLSVVATIPALLLMIVYRWDPRTPVWLIAGAVLLGMASWLIALVVMRHPLAEEGAAIAARVHPRLGALLRRDRGVVR